MTFYRTDALRKGLGLLGFVVAAALMLVVSDMPYAVVRALHSGIAAAHDTTNYGYCVHLIRHGRSWDLLQGIGRRAEFAY
ncbi:hypothetical protein [Mycobacterium sp.]|uniref:hypothetical protein n=1 Tax=Mycobacterium sp. TaxID=1785 RepID=UPI003F9EAF01